MNPQLIRFIKIISPIIMMGAIGLDIAIAYFFHQGDSIPKHYLTVGVIGSLIVAAHTVEGIIAAILTRSSHANPWKYGVYTFLVGTVGLLELYEQKKNGILTD